MRDNSVSIAKGVAITVYWYKTACFGVLSKLMVYIGDNTFYPDLTLPFIQAR